MHPFVLPADVVARMMARRGKAHPHADADPRRTALLVIDLQNGFMEPGTAFALCAAAPAIVPNVNRLAAALRDLQRVHGLEVDGVPGPATLRALGAERSDGPRLRRSLE